MPPRPERTPLILPKNASLRQVGLHLASQYALGMGEKYGPDYQTFQDFFDSIDARYSEEYQRDRNNPLDKKEAQEFDPKIQFLDQRDKSPTWATYLSNLRLRRSGLEMRIKGLAEAMNAGNAERAERILKSLSSELEYFARDYTNYRTSAGNHLINQHPELYAFDRLWGEGDFQKGKEVEQVLDNARKAGPEKGDSPVPEEEKKPIWGDLSQQPQKEAEDDGIEIFNINEAYLEQERAKSNGERFKARTAKEVYTPGKESYEGLLGYYAEQAKQADPVETEELLSKALTVAQFRREGREFDREQIEIQAEILRDSSGFLAMSTNRKYMREVLSKPHQIDKALETYQTEQAAAERKTAAPKSYDEYLRRHTWPNVPEGREEEYLAKSIAAHRLASNGVPFNLEEIRSDASVIQKQGSFRVMTTQSMNQKPAAENLRRWLHRENLQPASHALATLRKQKLAANAVEPKNRNQKSWAGYRRMHTQENVPANASAKEKRLLLAKAAVALRGMADDQTFSVKTARKQAEKLMKNKYFLAATKDPKRVDEILRTGRVTAIFEDMADVRKHVVARKNPTADVSIPTYQGQDRSVPLQPEEKPVMSI